MHNDCIVNKLEMAEVVDSHSVCVSGEEPIHLKLL